MTTTSRPIVLVIDDEQILLRAMVRMLATDFNVLAYECGNDAITYLASEAPCDAVLCDVGLMDMTGLAFHARLQQLRPELATRFVFMTGSDAGAEVEPFLKQHEGRVLLKPFGRAELIATLHTLLDTGAGREGKADS